MPARPVASASPFAILATGRAGDAGHLGLPSGCPTPSRKPSRRWAWRRCPLSPRRYPIFVLGISTISQSTRPRRSPRAARGARPDDRLRLRRHVAASGTFPSAAPPPVATDDRVQAEAARLRTASAKTMVNGHYGYAPGRTTVRGGARVWLKQITPRAVRPRRSYRGHGPAAQAGRPSCLSTSPHSHVTQGRGEVKNEQWDAAAGTLSARPGGRRRPLWSFPHCGD